ncbi:MAG: DUF5677 domain-containing protein [Clostridium sp.]|uniref:DUF5677 domain-containing protein n=1 Tax=Clostridium sp. TaxID=1506 RepID=UPI00290489EE|nr:DUF5677 domain-containing protein [Clostridium sp.]MDU1279197.1 DUF5677 domain-containing protein [Clostridium sp.]
MESDIYSIIKDKCKDQFEFYNELENYVERELLLEINNIKSKKKQTEQDDRVEYAISLLISQGIKAYKSNMILIREGYASNALIIQRSLVEIIFNIDYILENNKFKYKRANHYLHNKLNEKVWKRAELSLNKHLYKTYQDLSNYTHINFKSTSRNLKENGISIEENEDMVDVAAIIGNGIYYYFIYVICEIYDIDKKKLNSIKMPESVKISKDAYTAEKIVVSVFMDILKNNGIDTREALEEYKEYKLKKEQEEKSKRNRKQSKRNSRTKNKKRK